MAKYRVGDVIRAVSGITGKITRVGPNIGGGTPDTESDHYFVDIYQDDCEIDTRMSLIVPVDVGDNPPFEFTLIRRKNP